MDETATKPITSPMGDWPLTQVSVPSAAGDAAIPRAAMWEFFLAALVLALAFVLASSPAWNTDFWRHVATGRFLLENAFPFGVEPFTGTADYYWVNHSWLIDVAFYCLYGSIGGTGLVVLKSLVVVAVAGVLTVNGRAGKRLWLSCTTAILALLAMGPWLTLGPSCLSLLFLALTFTFLERGFRAPVSAQAWRTCWKPFWPLFPLLALWANVDQWFFLGPLLVVLYLLRELRNSIDGKAPGLSPRSLGLILCLALGVTLVNPHFISVWSAPVAFVSSGLNHPLARDSVLGDQYLQPFRAQYFSWQVLGHVPGPAFWVLVLIGVVSFIKNRAGRRRFLLIWAVFLILCIHQSAAIPFFAVAAAPLTAINLGQLAQSRPTTRAKSRVLFPLARLALISLVLSATIAAWAGLVQFRAGARGWRVEAERAFAHAGNTINTWCAQGRLGRAPAFSFSPAAGDLASWFCPAGTGYLDSRLHASAQELADYVAIRKGLMGLDSFGPDGERVDWRAVLRRQRTRLIVVFNRDLRQTGAVLRHLLTMSNEWPLLYLKGPVVIFGWRDPHGPQTPDTFAGLELDWDKKAYGAVESELAPTSGWQQEPQPFHWWEGFWKDRLPRSDDFDEAQLWLHCFDALKATYAQRNQQLWNGSLLAGLAASQALAGASPLEGSWRVFSAPAALHIFYLGADDGPRAPLFLALRATRRALRKQHVQDPRAFFLLGEIYSRLGNGREKAWIERFPRFARVRTVQAVAAYQYALRLQPDLVDAHARLVGHFDAMGFKDLALEHRKEVLKYHSRQRSRLANRAGFIEQLERLRKTVLDREQKLEEAREEFQVNSVNLKAADRALLAGRMGLAGKALEILLESDVAGFGTQGMDLELKLLLITGQTEKVRYWMEPRQEELLDAYHWNQLQLAAAIGNYQDADRELELLATIRGLDSKRQMSFRSAVGFMVGSSLLTEAAGGFYQKIPLRLLVPLRKIPMQVTLLLPDKQTAPGVMKHALDGMNQEAEYLLLRGLLAMEAGRNAWAKECFQKAANFWDSRAGINYARTDTGTPAGIARHCLEALSANSAEP